jgi:hypothetical protein
MDASNTIEEPVLSALVITDSKAVSALSKVALNCPMIAAPLARKAMNWWTAAANSRTVLSGKMTLA